MSSEDDWSSVLRTIYENELVIPKSTSSDSIDKIVDETDLDEDTVSSKIQYLSEIGLLYDPSRDNSAAVGKYVLSETGVRVAQQREMTEQQSQLSQEQSERQNDVNRAIGYLTLGLLTVTFLNNTADTLLSLAFPGLVPWFLTLLSGIVVLAISVQLYRDNLLTKSD